MKNNKAQQILIVDDNVNNIKLAASTLKSKGYNISFAQDGKSALEYVGQYAYDLILLDIMMPEMSGFDVCRRLKADEKAKDIPIIFLTAKTDADSVNEAFELGGVDYITKPFNNRELIARVKTHLQLKQQKDDLSGHVATKDKFFSIIAHDLKNPFYQMINLGSLLETNISRKNYEQAQRIGGLITKSAQEGYRLLDNLLQWSRAQTGRIQFKEVDVNLHDAVESVFSVYRETANAKKIQLQNNIRTGITLSTDADMLATVLRNLISNALKFTPEKGLVIIGSEQIDNKVKVTVTDTGVGIEPEDVDKLFRIDVSYSQTGTNQEEGSGLGLILCREFILRMEGDISVESDYGKGSTFAFTLPEK